jgi:hypothetical protein
MDTAVQVAFEKACAELGIGNGSLDVAKRECLIDHLLKLTSLGVSDVAELQLRTVSFFRSAMSADHFLTDNGASTTRLAPNEP